MLVCATAMLPANAVAQTARGAVSGAIIGGAVGGRRGAAIGATAGAVHGAFRNDANPTHRNFAQRGLQDRGYDVIGWQ